MSTDAVREPLAESPTEASRVDRRLLPAAIAAWVSALLSTLGWQVSAWVLAAAVAVAACVLLMRSRMRMDVNAPAGGRVAPPTEGRRGASVVTERIRAVSQRLPALALPLLVAAAAAGIVAACALAAHPVRRPPDVVATTPGAVEIVGTVLSSCRAVTGGTVCAVTGDVRAGEARATRVPVLLFLPDERWGAPTASSAAAPPPFGATVRVTGYARALPPEDSAGFMVSVDELAVTPPEGVLAWTASLRAGLSAAASALPGDGGALLPGLAIGDTASVDVSLEAAMRGASLTHLTAVSGANCAIVIAGATSIAALLGAGRRTRVLVGAAALGMFVLLVTPEPSVVRAATMGVIGLIGVFAARAGGGVPALSATVVVLLCLDPWLGRNYGFALSVLATGGLLLLARPLTRMFARRLPPRIAAALALPTAAQLACQPVLVLLDPAVAVYGIPANLLAAPAAPLATVVGMLACLCLPLAPPLGAGLAWIAWLPATWIGGCARLFSALPAARADWVPGVAGAVLLAALTAAGLVAVRARAGPARRVAGWIVVATAVLGAAAGAASWVSRAVHRPADWVIAACDVGQGDAIVLRSMQRVALVDTGPDPAALQACLTDLGIDRVDLLVLTHWDADHDGGLAAVTGRVAHVLHGPLADDGDRVALDALVEGGAGATDARRGLAGSLGAASWRVLWPVVADPSPGNDASIVLEVRGLASGVPPIVLLGDLGAEAQQAVLGAGVPPHDVGGIVKVAHHGSADQSPRLYEALQPVLGIVSVGSDNDYGHPRPEPLAMLRRLRATIVRTDTDGLVLVGADAAGLWTWTSGPSPGPSP